MVGHKSNYLPRNFPLTHLAQNVNQVREEKEGRKGPSQHGELALLSCRSNFAPLLLQSIKIARKCAKTCLIQRRHRCRPNGIRDSDNRIALKTIRIRHHDDSSDGHDCSNYLRNPQRKKFRAIVSLGKRCREVCRLVCSLNLRTGLHP